MECPICFETKVLIDNKICSHQLCGPCTVQLCVYDANGDSDYKCPLCRADLRKFAKETSETQYKAMGNFVDDMIKNNYTSSEIRAVFTRGGYITPERKRLFLLIFKKHVGQRGEISKHVITYLIKNWDRYSDTMGDLMEVRSRQLMEK